MGRYQGTSGAAYEGTDGADVQRVGGASCPGVVKGLIGMILRNTVRRAVLINMHAHRKLSIPVP